jgi:hypothetical protein
VAANPMKLDARVVLPGTIVARLPAPRAAQGHA